jgi:hypothetical protein
MPILSRWLLKVVMREWSVLPLTTCMFEHISSMVTLTETITGILVILFIQWFFTWRFWHIGRSTLWIGFRIFLLSILVSAGTPC